MIINKTLKVNRDFNEYLKILKLPIKTKRSISLEGLLNDRYPDIIQFKIGLYLDDVGDHKRTFPSAYCKEIKFNLYDDIVTSIDMDIFVLSTMDGLMLRGLIEDGFPFLIKERVDETTGEFISFHISLEN